MIDFEVKEITDPYIRENFEKLRVFLRESTLLNADFKLFEVDVKNPSSDYIVIHNLGFKPKDILITYVSSGTTTPNYSQTTKNSISLNVSDVCKIRVLLGSI